MVAKARTKRQKQPQQTVDVRLYWKFSAYVFGFAILFGSVAYAYGQVTRDDVLPITELRIVGEFDQVKVETLKKIVIENLDGNFFTVDVKNIHLQMTGLPWVSFAWVDRVWPRTLQVRVVEEKPVAYLNGSGLLNMEGEVFAVEGKSELVNKLPQLSGSDEERETLINKYSEFSRYFRSYDLNIAALELDQRGSWKMRLSNNVEIVLGHEEVEKRLTRFLKIFGQQMAHGEVQFKRVDLRYANGFALSDHQKQTFGVVS